MNVHLVLKQATRRACCVEGGITKCLELFAREPHIAKMNSAELYHFFLICVVSGDLYVPGYDLNGKLEEKSKLYRTAKAHGIDPKAIRKKVEDAMTAKGK